MTFAAVTFLAAVLAFCSAERSLAINVNATLIDSGDWVRVHFSGVELASRAGCWIGVYSPSTVNVAAIPPVSPDPDVGSPPWTATAPIKYIHCSETPEQHYATTGDGYYDFVLLNMRADVTFWLFTGDILKPVPQVRTAAVNFIRNPPAQVHLSRTENLTQMRVSWNSKFPTTQAVKWGASATSMTNVVNATVTTYAATDLCGPPGHSQGWRDPGYFHSAIITGLSPGSNAHVYYSVGSDAALWTAAEYFVVPKSIGPHVSTSVVMIADVGVSEPDGTHYHWGEPDAHVTMSHAAAAVSPTGAKPCDLVFHIGDLAYATGYAAKWETFMYEVEWVAKHAPYMIGLGNHERDVPGTGNDIGDDDSGGECGLPTETRFTMPVPSHKQDDGWYSLNHGNVHFIMMDTEMECGVTSMQYRFIAADLAAVDRAHTPWVVFMGHRPMYWGNQREEHFGVLEPLLVQHKVDLCLWGHVHYAQVSCPMINSTCVKPAREGEYAAPVHVVLGNGGQTLSDFPLRNETAKWSLYQAKEYGYSILRTFDATRLTLEFYANTGNQLHYTLNMTRSWPRT